MILSSLIVAAALVPQAQPVSLDRVYLKGEKNEYQVKSHLQAERRQLGLNTFIPEDIDFHYKFTYDVTELKPDGIAVIRYKRPTMTQIDGETFEAPPKTQVIKTNWDLQLTMSPVNEILNIKDLAPPVKKTGKFAIPNGAPAAQADPIGRFAGEIYRLALFIGSLDSAMDFAPKLPFDNVNPGDTWKDTVGYQPQELKDKKGKQAVQRLDYVYTYKGVVDVNGKKYHRVNGTLDLNTDLATFIHQLYDLTSADTNLKEIRLKLKANIDYDLDVKTRKTIRAIATSEGSIDIVVTQFPDRPVQEERLKGRTTLTLLNQK